MGKHRHIKMSPRPVKIKSINMEKGIELSELELFFLAVQNLIEEKESKGKKGKKFKNGQKISYKKVQAILYELKSYFGLKGCFSFGICGTCNRFENSISSNGMYGECKGQEKHAFDSCNEHGEQGGGFGL